MATTPTYLVAKYVADPVRMEPRNIGVVLWSRGGVACRFMDANEASFVDDKKLYQRWVNFWSHACQEGEVQASTGGTVSSSKREFLDAIRDTQRGNYFMYEGGVLLDKLKASDRKIATDFLYGELVSTTDQQDEQAVRETLKSRSDALFEEVGLADREEFIDGYELNLEAEGVVQPFKFDHAFAPGSLVALFQRVHLGIQQSITNAAFLFEHAKTSAAGADRIAIVSGEDSNLAPSRRRTLLDKLCDVVDLSDFPAAKKRLSRFVGVA